jgi:hypothetical protein
MDSNFPSLELLLCSQVLYQWAISLHRKLAYISRITLPKEGSLKDINDFIHFWHCVKQPYCILTLSNSWHERFCFVLYLWEGRNKIHKATKNLKILMTTVPPGGLFEYTWRPIFVSASVHRWGKVSCPVPLHAMEAFGGRRYNPSHSWPRH